ncbi:MAG: undecaprenyl-diphosphate phosphatase, partial [Clostridiales bacterium]|nr:undecaprenyl-diphosphate phosphatase [Clostridiales bacterium]
ADAVKEGFDVAMLMPYIIGIVVASVSGIAAIRFVKHLTQKKNFRPFAIYCTALGLITVILSLIF